MPRWCVVPIGVIWLAAGVPAAQAQVPLTFEEALAMAREKAPRVAVARARVDEARGRLVGAQMRFRENPVFDVSAGPRKLETGIVTDYELGFSQLVEPGSRRAARIAGAEAGIARETAISDASTRQIVRDVATAFVRALQAQARADVLRAAQAVAQEAFEVADQRFRAGDIAVLEVNVARGAG
jgi:cobalt-zinc-cadmium efflux system outer membrane protein